MIDSLAERLEHCWTVLPDPCRWFVACVGTALILGVVGGLLG